MVAAITRFLAFAAHAPTHPAGGTSNNAAIGKLFLPSTLNATPALIRVLVFQPGAMDTLLHHQVSQVGLLHMLL